MEVRMEAIYRICCGVDVHKKMLVACLRRGGKHETKQFGTSTEDILDLSGWLMEEGCEAVAMESTASYWKPLYNVLEASGMEVIVANARHIKTVPGRKTDVSDAAWIADLLMHGLIRASYIPPKEQREMREFLQYRLSLVKTRADELNRLQKMLEGGNIKLSGTVSDIMGMSSRRLLEGMLSGKKFTKDDIDEMFEDGTLSRKLKASSEQIAKDCNGILSSGQTAVMRMVIAHIDELSAKIKELDGIVEGQLSQEQQAAVKALTAMPGIKEVAARNIIAVIGTDMSRFPSPQHLCSWAGLCPGNNESAGKRRSGRTRLGNKLLRATLVQAAQSASRCKDTFYAAQYSKIAIRRGKNRAKVAVAHSMLISIWHILHDRVDFRDLGADYYNQFNREKKAGSLMRKLADLGYSVSVEDCGLAVAQ